MGTFQSRNRHYAVSVEIMKFLPSNTISQHLATFANNKINKRAMPSKRKGKSKKNSSKRRRKNDSAPSTDSIASNDIIYPVETKELPVLLDGSQLRITLNPTLYDFFGGVVSPEQFLTTYFRQRALHIDCTDKWRKHRTFFLRRAMFNLNPQGILSETSSDSIFVWLKEKREKSVNGSNGKFERKDSLIRSIEVADAETALALHFVGHSTYCRAPPSVEQHLVASLLRETGLGCGHYDRSGESNICLGRGEVETFISASGHVTNWHFDFQENFTIQLSGIKKWTLVEGTIVDPLRGCTPHYNSPEVVESQLKAAYLNDKKFVFGKPTPGVNAKGQERAVILKPGDVLYFPAGMWHKVETIESGVSINVSLMATNYAETICRAICQYLSQDARFRQPIINNKVMSATNQLQELLRDLPATIQQLCKPNGEGANDILPPLLQFPPSSCAFQEEEMDILENDDSDEDESNDVEEGDNYDGAAEREDDNYDVPSDVSQDSTHLNEDETIDPATFLGYPPTWHFTLEMGSCAQLYKNPLSALHKLEELTSYYSDRDVQEEQESGVFVLNVNYGGNESHESAIRVQFRDNRDQMVLRLWNLERTKPSDAKTDLLDECVITEDNHHMISFLVFHGYIQVQTSMRSKCPNFNKIAQGLDNDA
jgi:hypothetical protein